MEINVNVVLFEEWQETADDNSAVARIVIIHQNRDCNLALGDDGPTFFPLD